MIDPRRSSAAALAFAMGFSVLTSACRVNEDDIHRWEGTAHGPEKLKAVLLHDKYDTALRVESALSLIRMKARQGRRIGIPMMIESLAELPPEQRGPIVAQMVPAIVAELKKPPPVGQAGQPSPPDPSFPYKDAAFEMLSYDKTVIITDPALQQQLKQALIDWAMADFEHRLDNRTQVHGMEQLLRFLGAPAVVGIPKLMTRDARRLDQMANLVSELGDDATKLAASKALVAIAQYVISDDWRKTKTPELQAANAASKLQPTPAQFDAQLAQYQDEELFRVLGAMKKVGGRPSIDFDLELAGRKDQNEKRRQAALAAVEGRLDRNNPDDVKRILAIATTPDTPDAVLDQAFRRIGEMPRDQVVGKLYDLFRTDKWKVRRAAGVTVLKMSTPANIDEFMGKLAEIKNMSMPEALTYGATLGDLAKGSVDPLKPWMSKGDAAQRTTALAYYFSFGTPNQVGDMQSFESDRTSAPSCDADADCKWQCLVPKEGAKDPNDREPKDVKSVGDFVKFCIEPAMKERKPEAAAPKGEQPKKDEKK